jgi:hypothetical protein
LDGISADALTFFGVRRQSEATTALLFGVPRLRGCIRCSRCKADSNDPKRRRRFALPAHSKNDFFS